LKVPDIAMAKQRTAAAVLELVKLADMYMVPVTDNARAISRQTDTYLATAAAENLKKLLGVWTVWQLYEAEDENFIIFPASTDPKAEDDEKGYNVLFNAYEAAVYSDMKFLDHNDLSYYLLNAAKYKIRTAKMIRNMVRFADSRGAHVDDSVRDLAECTEERAAMEVNKIHGLLKAGYYVNSKEVVKAFYSVPRMNYTMWNRIVESRIPEMPEASDPKSAISEFYSDISDVLTDIGEGIAGAQMALDETAINTQREMLADEELLPYGLYASRYVIPETEFTAKIEVGVTNEEEFHIDSDGAPISCSKVKVMTAFSNAAYDSRYNKDKVQRSSLRIKYVPAPMPAAVKVPDVKGLMLKQAKEILENAAVRGVFIGVDGFTFTCDDGLVIAQSMPGGEIMLASKPLVLTVKEIEIEEPIPEPAGRILAIARLTSVRDAEETPEKPLPEPEPVETPPSKILATARLTSVKDTTETTEKPLPEPEPAETATRTIPADGLKSRIADINLSAVDIGTISMADALKAKVPETKITDVAGAEKKDTEEIEKKDVVDTSASVPISRTDALKMDVPLTKRMDTVETETEKKETVEVEKKETAEIEKKEVVDTKAADTSVSAPITRTDTLKTKVLETKITDVAETEKKEVAEEKKEVVDTKAADTSVSAPISRTDALKATVLEIKRTDVVEEEKKEAAEIEKKEVADTSTAAAAKTAVRTADLKTTVIEPAKTNTVETEKREVVDTKAADTTALKTAAVKKSL
ncbi:MAG: PASTA domain-containing protein, partial [Methanomassiliicoccaceae archaeon]|nr:PASTA domain-containing protein [Methanomassiliicoccaceae archaeon]